MDSDPSIFDLTSTEELVSKLFSRFDHAVFGGIRERKEGDDEITRDWTGKEFTCKGICTGIIERINEDLNEDMEDSE